MVKPVAKPRGAGALAGEPAGDDIDPSGSPSPNCSRVGVDRDAGEAQGEDFSPPGVGLAEPGVLEAGEVQAVGKEPRTVEEPADTQHPSAPSRFVTGFLPATPRWRV